jgi:hypothetical protein
MHRLIRTALIVLGAAVLHTAPVAAEIYTWTDADGTVHYGDKPGTTQATKLDIESRATDKVAVAERYSRRQAARTEQNEERAEQRASAEEQAAEAEAEREARQAQCEKARERLGRFVNARRLYRVDENGERQYLDDAEIDQARARAEEAVTRHCD